MTTLKKITRISLSLIFLTTIFTSCKKNWGEDTVIASNILFVHAAAGTGNLDFIVDNQKATSLSYTNKKGYFLAYPGSRYFGITKQDSIKYISTLTANLKPNAYYSIFALDSLGKSSILVVEDQLTVPTVDKATIRFINLSPDSSSLNLQLVGDSNPLFGAKAFKQYSEFINIPAAESATFEVKDSDSNLVKATLSNIKLEKGKVYTIWARGLKLATDSTKFELSSLIHN